MGVTIDPHNLVLTVGGNRQLDLVFDPPNAANKNAAWESNRPEVATVSNTGLVTAVGVGVATITVTTADGNHTSTCNVSVEAACGKCSQYPCDCV